MLHLLSRQISDVNKGVIKWSKDMSYSKNIFTFTGLKISESLIVWDHTVVHCNGETILLPTYMSNKTTHSHKRELELDWAWKVKRRCSVQCRRCHTLNMYAAHGLCWSKHKESSKLIEALEAILKINEFNGTATVSALSTLFSPITRRVF